MFKEAVMFKRVGALLVFLIAIAFFYSSGIIQALIIGDMKHIQLFLDNWGIFAPLVSISLILLQAFIAPIPAVFIYIANGIIFGAALGFLISWIGSILSAYLCFALVRHFNLDMKLKNDFLRKIMAFFEYYGEKAVFIVRLMPFIPTDLVSYAFGFTRIKTRHYVLGTALGQIPAILFYSIWGGMQLPLLWNILAIAAWAVIILGILKVYDIISARNELENSQSGNGI